MNANVKITTAEVQKWNETTRKDVARELAAFQRLLPGLLVTHSDRFVAIAGGEIVDHDQDEFSLADRVSRKFQGRFVLIQEVIANEMGKLSGFHK